MNYSFEYIDIILLAMIAGFIFLRLRGILGKRTGFEGKTPAQFKEVLKNVPIPQGSSLEFMGGNKVVLETADTLTVNSDTNNSIDASLTIMEIT